MESMLKKTKVELELLTNTDMLLMVEKDIRGVTCPAIHQYTTANNKYIKNYNENKKSSYLIYWDANKLYGWTKSQ